jgi:hypothetical protein
MDADFRRANVVNIIQTFGHAPSPPHAMKLAYPDILMGINRSELG